MCCAHDIIEAKNLAKVARTVVMLVNYNQYMQQQQLQKQQANLEYLQANSVTTIGSVMSHHNSAALLASGQPQSQQQTAV